MEVASAVAAHLALPVPLVLLDDRLSEDASASAPQKAASTTALQQ